MWLTGRARRLTVVDETSPSLSASFFFFLTFICSERGIGEEGEEEEGARRCLDIQGWEDTQGEGPN